MAYDTDMPERKRSMRRYAQEKSIHQKCYSPNLINAIFFTIKRCKLTAPLVKALTDNRHIPFYILRCLAVAAELKRKTSLTDVPFAVTESELLADLEWSLWDNGRDVNEELFRKARCTNFVFIRDRIESITKEDFTMAFKK